MKFSKFLGKSLLLLSTFVISQVIVENSAFAATSYLQQLPFSNKTDPDKNRANGYCSEDNDCPPGYYCSTWGTCTAHD